MRKYIVIIFTLFSSLLHATFVEEFPNVKQFIYEDPSTYLHMGFGMSPISIMNDKIYFSGNLFQIHWIKDLWDIELFSASYGTTVSGKEISKSKHFVFRTVPKVKLFGIISGGAVFGYEFVRFTNVQTRLFKNNFVTPLETFTTAGPIYGVAFSETINIGKSSIFKLTQLVYKQNYSITETKNKWEYLYQDEVLQDQDKRGPIEAGTVFMLEFSYLF